MSQPDLTLKTRPWMRRATPWAAIALHPYAGAGTPESPFVVDWIPSKDGFVDVENANTFSSRYSWSLAIIAGSATLAVSMGSSMLSAAIPEIVLDYPNYPAVVYILVTSIYVAGFVVGPFLWAPLSELYGRRRVFIYTYIPFTAFCAAVCGAKSMEALLVLRFFAGMFGASAMTNSGGVIADIFTAERRGLALAVFAIAPFLGPAIGPVAGGFLGEYEGWKWVAAVIALFSFVITAAGVLYLPETYAATLLRARANRLTAATGKSYKTKADISQPPTRGAVFGKALAKPWTLFKEPIVSLMAAYLSVVYAILYMQFTSFPIIFTKVRGWSPAISGLAFVGISIGAFVSLLWIIFVENPRYTAISKASGGFAEPETRLLTPIFGAVMLPIGLIIFAWTGSPATIHWIAPIIGTVIFGAAIVFVFLGVSNYLVDSYMMFAASVLAGNTVCRSVLGVVFPLFTAKLYSSLGVNYAGTLIAGLAFLFTPCPVIFYIYGKRIRRATKASRAADDLANMMRDMYNKQTPAAAAPVTAGASSHSEEEEKETLSV